MLFFFLFFFLLREQQSGPPEHAKGAAGCWCCKTRGFLPEGANGVGQRRHPKVWARYCAIDAGAFSFTLLY